MIIRTAGSCVRIKPDEGKRLIAKLSAEPL
jgi:hypothetical protein